MTDAEWLAASEPDSMLSYLGQKGTERDYRRFVIACALRLLPKEPDEVMMAALAMSERQADGTAKRIEIAQARKALASTHPARHRRWPVLFSDHIRSVPAWHALRVQNAKNALYAAESCAWASTRTGSSRYVSMTFPGEEYAFQAVLLRDIFGNPFRPVSFDPAWLTPTVVALAYGIYGDRAFDRMPILADALEEAGCDNVEVLLHCRGDGPHVRGCWVVDAVLGKK